MFLLRLFHRATWPNAATTAFARANMLATCSTGLLISTTVLFFLHATALDTAGIARAATIGTFTGLATIPWIGRLARSYGATRIYRAALVVQAATLLAWQAASGSLVASAVLIASSVATAAVGATIGSFITELGIPAPQMASARASLRTITNIGIGTGGLIAAGLFRFGDHGPRAAVGLAAACTFAAYLLVRRTVAVPAPTKATAHAATPRSPYRDPRYAGLALTNGVLSTHTEVLTYGLPAMVALSATMGDWVIGLCTALNAVAVVLLQVPTTATAGRLRRRTVVAIAAGATVAMSLLFAIGATHSTLLVLFAGVVALTVGELWQSSAEFDISYAAAPDNNHQEYQAAYAFGRNCARAAAPITLGWVVLTGAAGWLTLTAIYAACGIVHLLLAHSIDT
ncbi:hypothetical protein C1Y63_04000 [Corynebacterium sp. 13CS0277]|uniref:MFS transporter n=1 Tax=Corynebacterium sp. 13CS0277 TaxID=2071994 RepID=UPI000D02D0BF|nr:MFS transporter [Corynebacterium sp. 13CS0277]PRQ11813.1 hypothetical protein C1Y63_04000 [Corynebacterium sp. 13CS0277]